MKHYKFVNEIGGVTNIVTQDQDEIDRIDALLVDHTVSTNVDGVITLDCTIDEITKQTRT